MLSDARKENLRWVFVLTIFLVIPTKKKQKHFANFVKLLVVGHRFNLKYGARHSYLQSEVFFGQILV